MRLLESVGFDVMVSEVEPLATGPFQESIEVIVMAANDDAERKLILATLQAHDGDKPAAVDVVGLSLLTLYNRLKDYEPDDSGGHAGDID